MPTDSTLSLPRPLHAGAARTLAGALAGELRKRILSGEIPEETFLRQDVLAKEYNISRIPVREALSQLAAEGLIVLIPHRGAQVPRLSPDDVFDIYDIRAVLEPHLIRQAVPLMNDADLQAIRAALDACDEALKSGRFSEWGELNARFHHSLYEPTKRPHGSDLIQKLLDKSERYAKLNLAITGETSHAQEEHWEIYRCCVKGDAAGAADLMRRHIRNSGDSLVTAIRRKMEQAPRPSEASARDD